MLITTDVLKNKVRQRLMLHALNSLNKAKLYKTCLKNTDFKITYNSFRGEKKVAYHQVLGVLYSQ